MIVDERMYYFKNGEMKLLSSYKLTYKIPKFEKLVRKWYAIHPYGKKLNDEWICGDYRIDQQRPQRNVYSEAYLKIVSISEMEKKIFDKLIEERESKINYPTVYDDGEKRYYEDTIHCPKCGRRRKVLTSHSHCEFCGFEFKEAKKCPKCKDLSLKDSDNCSHCGYDFVNSKKNKINKETIKCSECRTINNSENKYCINCGHKLKKISKKDKSYKKYCTHCGMIVERGENYCKHCGNKVKKRLQKETICAICGEWNENENKYCWNCGHNTYKRGLSFRIGSVKKCPNCKSHFVDCYNYCEECGTKLVKK